MRTYILEVWKEGERQDITFVVNTSTLEDAIVRVRMTYPEEIKDCEIKECRHYDTYRGVTIVCSSM